MNPDFDVCALDYQSLSNKVSLSNRVNVHRKDLTIQKIAALARLELLAKHGGVWTDATVFCAVPLSNWLDDYLEGRFFAFRDPGPDRLMSNWFIAAEPDSIILERLREGFLDFFVSNHFSNQNTKLGKMALDFLGARWNTNPTSTVLWHSWLVRKVLRIYPYFIFHYTFNKLVLEDDECRRLWYGSRPFSAAPAHRLQELSQQRGGIELAKRLIECQTTPMHKLDWRVDVTSGYWKATLQHLGALL